MAGYDARQSTISDGNVGYDSLWNDEYNAILAAFAALTGHKHDGSAGEGGYIPILSDVDAKNKIYIDAATNQVDFYSEVAGVSTLQFSLLDGQILPTTDNDIDLGSATKAFKDLYVAGAATLASAAISGGTATSVDISGSTIESTPIGTTTATTGRFTTIESTTTTGTAPLIVVSTTVVPNLNADKLDGQDAPSGTIVGTSDTQTLTNKTIDLTDNTITGTLAEVNTAISDDDVFGVSELTQSVGNLLTPLCSIDLQNGISGKWKGNLTYENLTAVDRSYVDRYGDRIYVGTDKPRDGLLEGSATNAYPYSWDFSQATWIKNGDITAATDGTLAADGTTQMYKLTSADFTAAANHIYDALSSTDAGQDIACSFEVLAGTEDKIELRTTATGGTSFDYSSIFDMVTGTWTTQHANHKNFYVKELIGGRYDIGLVVTMNNTGNTNINARLSGGAASTSAYFYASSAQLVDGASFVTSYQPTNGASVTRLDDKLNFPARGNIPNPDNGLTIFMDFTPLADGADYDSIRLFASEDSGGSVYEWRTYAAGSYGLTGLGSGGFAQSIVDTDIVAGIKARWAFSYKNVGANVEWAVSKDGVPKGSGSVAGNIIVPDSLMGIGLRSQDNSSTDGIYDNIRIMDHTTGTEVIIG